MQTTSTLVQVVLVLAVIAVVGIGLFGYKSFGKNVDDKAVDGLSNVVPGFNPGRTTAPKMGKIADMPTRANMKKAVLQRLRPDEGLSYRERYSKEVANTLRNLNGYQGNIFEHIVDESIKHNVDPYLVIAIITVESRGGAKRTSGENAVGLMQVTPVACTQVCKRTTNHFRACDENQKCTIKEIPTKPKQNINMGLEYLEYLMRPNGTASTIQELLAAYNGGEGNIGAEATTEYANKAAKYYRELK